MEDREDAFSLDLTSEDLRLRGVKLWLIMLRRSWHPPPFGHLGVSLSPSRFGLLTKPRQNALKEGIKIQNVSHLMDFPK